MDSSRVALALLLLAVAAAADQMLHQAVPATPRNSLLAGATRNGDQDNSRIIHGTAATAGQFPYQAALYMDSRSFCGGALISDQWVLTAAHCGYRHTRFTVYLGALDMMKPHEDNRVVYTTTAGHVHEKYNPSLLDNDVCLVGLPRKVTFNAFVTPINLPPRSYASKTLEGEAVRVSGWGKPTDSSETISPNLQYADLKVISNAECGRQYGNDIISSKILCCAAPGGLSTCNGDSGGPLVLKEASGSLMHVAVVSFVSSNGCGSGAPSGYDRTASFLDWIHDKTNIPIRE